MHRHFSTPDDIDAMNVQGNEDRANDYQIYGERMSTESDHTESCGADGIVTEI